MTSRSISLSRDKEYRNHPKQRGAAHVWFDMCADTLNNANVSVPVVIEILQKYGVRWTGTAFKELVWKVILKALTDKDSTEDQNTAEPQMIEREIVVLLGEKLGVELPPWPDRHNQHN